MRRFEGKVALVTGATKQSAIGAEIASRFCEEGASVVVAGRDIDGGTRVAQGLQERGFVASFREVDLASADSIRALIETSVDSYGRLDVLVNNAAAMDTIKQGRDKPAADIDIDVWDQAFNINVRGAFICSKFSIPHMLAAGGGAIVNISTLASLRAMSSRTAYSSSKAALNGLTMSIAVDYAPLGIRCNAVVVASVRNQDVEPAVSASSFDSLMIPRWGEVGDVASMVAFLASSDSSFTTGALVPVDGGALGKFVRPASPLGLT